jgi:hypothetical protein
MIEGGPTVGVQDEDARGRTKQFDFLGSARKLAATRYPLLCEPRPELEGLTLVFEFLHPETRNITNYGDRQDLVLLACFDRREWRYRTYAEIRHLAGELGLTAVDELIPAGHTIAEQIDSLLGSIAGTDQEGSVIIIEHAHQVVYRVKVKSPDYLRILKLVVTCNYARAAEMIDEHPEWTSWDELAKHLRGLGREQVPEEVLEFYRGHFETHAGYLVDCERLREWAQETAERVLTAIRNELEEGSDRRLLRKQFAARAVAQPLSPLLFAAFDGRLSVAAVRQLARTPDEAKEALTRIHE